MEKLLIVIDMQKDFLDGSLGTKEAVNILPRVMEKIKNHDGKVIFTRDTHSDKYLGTQEGRKLPVVHCVEGSEGWRLAKEIENLATERRSRIFDKPSFGSIELAKYVSDIHRDGQVDVIELVGLCTDICVISNAMILKAAMPEVAIEVDSSCCAGVTPESHNNALEAMKICQIGVK